MRSFFVLVVVLGRASVAMAADRFDPSGSYELWPGYLDVMTAGSKAVAFYWGVHPVYNEQGERAGRDITCDSVLLFERVADGTWKVSDKSSDKTLTIIRVSAIGTKFEVSEEDSLSFLGQGTKDKTFACRDPPKLCQVVKRTAGPLKVGMTVAAIRFGDEPRCELPELVESVDSSEQANSSKELVRARIGSVDKLFLVLESWLDCTNAKPAGGQSKRQIAHASALALFNSGKQKEAAEALYDAVDGSTSTMRGEEVEIFNDLGFFLEQAKRYKDAVGVLKAVLEVAPDRMVAYLNLGDAYLGLKDVSQAKAAYKEYQRLMLQSGKGSKIPKRIQQYLDKD